MKSLKLLFFILFIAPFICASPIDEIEKLSPYYFADIFDHALYDLEHSNTYDHEQHIGIKLNLDAEAKLNHLHARKLKRVQDTLIKELDEYQLALADFNWQTALDQFYSNTFSSIVAGGILKTFMKDNKFQVAMMAIGATCLVSACQVGLKYWFGVSEERNKIAILKKQLIAKISNEPINDLEKLYLDHQSHLSKQERFSIEKALLGARKNKIINEGADAFEIVRDIISFPKDIIAPIPTHTIDEFVTEKENFLAQTFPSLANANQPEVYAKTSGLDSVFYKEETRQSLKSMISKTLDHTFTKAPTIKGYIFYGAPGTGKTHAAELVAQTLNLPFYKLKIMNRADFQKDALYGSRPSSFSKANKGSLIEAFLTTNADGKRAQNLVILLDDIDRGFASKDGTSTDIEGLMNFLLDLFDINNASIPANYYGTTLDFNQVILIATMNRDIRVDDKFKALHSRCDFIDFKTLDKAQAKLSLKGSITDDAFKLSQAFRSQPDMWDAIRKDIADFIIDSYDPDDNRKRIQRALELVQTPKESWKDLAHRRQW